jgi:hypothetical protein
MPRRPPMGDIAESRALALANAYQNATGFNLKQPPLFAV